MSDQIVSLTVENGIAKVSLNRPEKHNALNIPMFKAIDAVIKKIKKDKSIRVVIVSGNGVSFCSGLDIKSVLTKASNFPKLLWKWLPGNANLAQRVTVGWRKLPVPVIMVLHGKCWGGGMQIALGGDYRIASNDCELAVMEARWGIIPDMGGTLGLRECVTSDHAIRLAMTAESIDADSALSMGLVSQVAEDPFEQAMELANRLLNKSPDTNRKIKAMYHSIWCREERRILALETINQIKVLAGKNQRITVKREQTNKDIPFIL